LITLNRFRSYVAQALWLSAVYLAHPAAAQTAGATPTPAVRTVDRAQTATVADSGAASAQAGGQDSNSTQSPQATPATPPQGTPDAPTPQSPQNAQSSDKTSAQTKHEEAEQQLKVEEKQRVVGIVPIFNTSYNWNAAPLSAGQKFRLAFRGAIDPAVIAIAALDAGWSMEQDSFPAYRQGVVGYSKYLGASYADTFDGAMIGNALFPVLLKQDPRYFRKGEEYSFKNRLFYSIATTFWCRNDNGKWGPNYSNVLGNLAAGGISNLYYPAADRGVGLTFERGLTVTAEGTLGGVFDEFWPDIARKVLRGRFAKLQTGLPPANPTPTTPPNTVPATPTP
jgi:hypothetical protein